MARIEGDRSVKAAKLKGAAHLWTFWWGLEGNGEQRISGVESSRVVMKKMTRKGGGVGDGFRST